MGCKPSPSSACTATPSSICIWPGEGVLGVPRRVWGWPIPCGTYPLNPHPPISPLSCTPLHPATPSFSRNSGARLPPRGPLASPAVPGSCSSDRWAPGSPEHQRHPREGTRGRPRGSGPSPAAPGPPGARPDPPRPGRAQLPHVLAPPRRK